MHRKFINNLFFILLLNLLVKPFWIIGIDVGVQNRVGAEEYGLYYPIFGFSILLNIILDFGITNYNNKNIAQHSQMLGRYFSGIFNVKLFLGVIYLGITLVLGYFIGYDGKAFYLLFLLAINQFLSSMILYLRSNISGLHLFKTDGLLSVMDRLLMIVFCSILLWSSMFEGIFKIEWFVYAQFWAYLLTSITAFFIVLYKAKFFKMKVDVILFRIIIKESLPFALLVLLMSFYYRLDAVMIERLLPDGRVEVGIYAQAYRILDGVNMVGYLFAGILLPIFSRMIKEKLAINKLVKSAFTLIFIPSCALALICWLHAKDFMDLLYVEHAEKSAAVFGILMLSFVPIGATYVYGTLLTANGSLKQLNIISLIGLALNFTLNILWIPVDGAYGAAMATLLTQVFVVITQIVVIKNKFQISYSIKYISKVCILLLSSFFVASYTNDLINSYILHSLLTVSVFVSLSFILGLIRMKEVSQFLKKEQMG